MRLNQDTLDAIALVSFIVGIANYNENLTQNDKDDIMRHLDQQTRDILVELQKSIEEQNAMLREILSRLEK
jgi:hypothetical protein